MPILVASLALLIAAATGVAGYVAWRKQERRLDELRSGYVRKTDIVRAAEQAENAIQALRAAHDKRRHER